MKKSSADELVSKLESEKMLEHEPVEVPRRQSEIDEAVEEFRLKVWYNRHQIRCYEIETGQTKLVDKEPFPIRDHANRPMRRDVWKGALRAAAHVEKMYGLENLVWSEFEWGMLNGKLSALRWVFGEEWDELYT